MGLIRNDCIGRMCMLLVWVCCWSRNGMVNGFFTGPSLVSRRKLISKKSELRGILTVGTPLDWKDSLDELEYVRKAGVQQFLSTYKRVKDLKGDELLWGDEVEYGIFHISGENDITPEKTIKLSLRASQILEELKEREQSHDHWMEGCNWVPEYGGWMLEATPSRPYAGYTTDLLRVERNMRLRRKRLLRMLNNHEIAPTMSTFPLLGALQDLSIPATTIGGPITQSTYIPDGIINPHPRFGTLSRNIRQRRGSKVNIRIPLYRDANTPEYKDYPPIDSIRVCGDNTDGTQVWRYGNSLPANHNLVSVGCSKDYDSFWQDLAVDTTDICWEPYLVDVQSPGCRGLFYRSSPRVIVPDADWPRNGEIVYGYPIPHLPNWIRLQNGYYLPTQSEDGAIQFLQKQSTADAETDEDAKNDGRQETDESSENESSSNNNDVDYKNVRPAIHMDAMAFGMGCCCLQVTFQGKDMEESRYMYDQLAVMAPILMALTAATPVMKGRISDVDCRWGVISEAVDCRTPAERGLENRTNSIMDKYAGGGKRRIPKSRYDSISTYIHPSGRMYNDKEVVMDEETYAECRSAGVDVPLSQHMAHLFIRDPLVMFQGAIRELNNETQTEHFESIQSTNWQTVRWKPPPPPSASGTNKIGWRTEFRSMELQLTDFENAAFTVLIVLLTRVILSFDLNLYIPLSRIDANMQRAHSRDAARNAKFFFRRHLAPLEEGDDGYGVTYSSMFARRSNNNNNSTYTSSTSNGIIEDEENSYEEMTIDEIMNGKGDYFPGLLPLIFAYLDTIPCDEDDTLRQYMEFISKRARGELLTPATWMRQFLNEHPAYQHDSVVTTDMAYDLCQACHDIGVGKRHEPSLLGDIQIEPIDPNVGTYAVKLDSKRVNNEQLLDLLERYTHRQPHSPQQNNTSSAIN